MLSLPLFPQGAQWDLQLGGYQLQLEMHLSGQSDHTDVHPAAVSPLVNWPFMESSSDHWAICYDSSPGSSRGQALGVMSQLTDVHYWSIHMCIGQLQPCKLWLEIITGPYRSATFVPKPMLLTCIYGFTISWIDSV